MTTFDIARPALNGLGHIAGLPHALVAAVADWRARNATRKALLQLTDRELDDIGLDRWTVDNLRAEDLR